MKVIKKVGVLSMGNISGLFGIVMGLVTGLIYWLLGSSGSIPLVNSSIPEVLFSPWAVLIMPILYGIGYFLGGLVVAALYNLFSKWIGGVKIDF